MENSIVKAKRKHYLTVEIKGIVYDLRAMLKPDGEMLNLQHFENVKVRAIPSMLNGKYLGRTTVILTLPLGADNTKVLSIEKIRRADIIKECINKLKLMPSYKTPKQLIRQEKRRAENTNLASLGMIMPMKQKKKRAARQKAA